MASPDFDAALAETHPLVSEMKATVNQLRRELAKERARTEDLVDAVVRATREAVLAYGPIPPVASPPKDKRNKGDSVALVCTGDWQAAKVTPSYNGDVLTSRLDDYAAKVAELTELERSHRPVRHATVAFLGDMVEGLFNFPQQVFQVDRTIHDQHVLVTRLAVSFLRKLLATFDTVTVVAEWGNHGRIGNKRATVPSHDNFDRIAYTTARLLLADEPRVRWEDGAEDIQRLEIGDYRALVLHGDEVGRNGYVSRSTFASYITKLQAGAYRLGGHPWKFRDAYVGHYHTHAEEPLPDGEGAVYWCGSTESDNLYARDRLASQATPSQRLHFVDPDRGRVTAQYKVWLT
jgi:hypothetical protein